MLQVTQNNTSNEKSLTECGGADLGKTAEERLELVGREASHEVPHIVWASAKGQPGSVPRTRNCRRGSACRLGQNAVHKLRVLGLPERHAAKESEKRV